jgi:hypothetical protein
MGDGLELFAFGSLEPFHTRPALTPAARIRSPGILLDERLKLVSLVAAGEVGSIRQVGEARPSEVWERA